VHDYDREKRVGLIRAHEHMPHYTQGLALQEDGPECMLRRGCSGSLWKDNSTSSSSSSSHLLIFPRPHPHPSPPPIYFSIFCDCVASGVRRRAFDASFLPMLSPPKPWCSVRSGSYFILPCKGSDPCVEKISLVFSRTRAQGLLAICTRLSVREKELLPSSTLRPRDITLHQARLCGQPWGVSTSLILPHKPAQP
jgi:hypothetical protein